MCRLTCDRPLTLAQAAPPLVELKDKQPIRALNKNTSHLQSNSVIILLFHIFNVHTCFISDLFMLCLISPSSAHVHFVLSFVLFNVEIHKTNSALNDFYFEGSQDVI